MRIVSPGLNFTAERITFSIRATATTRMWTYANPPRPVRCVRFASTDTVSMSSASGAWSCSRLTASGGSAPAASRAIKPARLIAAAASETRINRARTLAAQPEALDLPRGGLRQLGGELDPARHLDEIGRASCRE